MTDDTNHAGYGPDDACDHCDRYATFRRIVRVGDEVHVER